MIDDSQLEDAIKIIEDYYFGEGTDRGETLFIDFAKKNKSSFMSARLSNSTENNFE